MKEIYIYGDIVDKESEKMSTEDICPQDIINQLKDNTDDVVVRINSCGGSVSAGLSIASYLQNIKQKTTCIIDGVAASIASVIACACDDLVMHPSSYLMIHRVWGLVQGNCEDLRKEADTMEMMTKSLIKIYQRKFDLSSEEIEKLLADETWISGDQIADYKINATVDDDEVVRYAAKLTDKFNKCPIIKMNKEEIKEEIKETVEEKKEETETVENPVVEEEEVKEEKTEETTEEIKEPVEDPEKTDLEKENEDLKKEIEDLKSEIETLKNEDVDKRVSGMQSKMQNKINDLVKDHTEKISKYENEIKDYQEKLNISERNFISLKDKLEKTEKELSEKISALSEKESALTQLNSGVLRQSDLLPSFADGLRNCKTLKDRVEFINSGKYTK